MYFSSDEMTEIIYPCHWVRKRNRLSGYGNGSDINSHQHLKSQADLELQPVPGRCRTQYTSSKSQILTWLNTCSLFIGSSNLVSLSSLHLCFNSILRNKQPDSIIKFNEYSRDLLILLEFEILDHNLRKKKSHTSWRLYHPLFHRS